MSGMGGMSRTGRGRERARAEIAVVRVLEKRLGALPVVAQFGRRLRIAEIVDELCPVRPVAWITHGEVIEALVANRLTAPAPMLRVQDWAAAMAVEEAYGIAPGLLNDDRIARALDAVAPQLDAITGGVGAAAVTEFGVDVSRLHWDLTSISLYGAYPETDEEYPAPRWGHPKDRRPDLKQIQTGLAVSGDGGIRTPATTRRQLAQLLASDALAIRCDLAPQIAGWPIACSWLAKVRPADTARTISQLRRLRQLRMCLSVTGPVNLVFTIYTRTVAGLAQFEEAIGTAAPGLEAMETLIHLRTRKRMGWLINTDGQATGDIVIPNVFDPG